MKRTRNRRGGVAALERENRELQALVRRYSGRNQELNLIIEELDRDRQHARLLLNPDNPWQELPGLDNFSPALMSEAKRQDMVALALATMAVAHEELERLGIYQQYRRGVARRRKQMLRSRQRDTPLPE